MLLSIYKHNNKKRITFKHNLYFSYKITRTLFVLNIMSPTTKKRLSIHFETMDVNKSIITMIKKGDIYNCTSTLCKIVFYIIIKQSVSMNHYITILKLFFLSNQTLKMHFKNNVYLQKGSTNFMTLLDRSANLRYVASLI